MIEAEDGTGIIDDRVDILVGEVVSVADEDDQEKVEDGEGDAAVEELEHREKVRDQAASLVGKEKVMRHVVVLRVIHILPEKVAQEHTRQLKVQDETLAREKGDDGEAGASKQIDCGEKQECVEEEDGDGQEQDLGGSWQGIHAIDIVDPLLGKDGEGTEDALEAEPEDVDREFPDVVIEKGVEEDKLHDSILDQLVCHFLYLDGPAGVKHEFLCEEDDQRCDADQRVSSDEEFGVGVAHLLDETRQKVAAIERVERL